ncbi:MAG TPA: imidazoleglycerol-phosphate dehydratase HisB [Thermomicrobiales bacterium]|jgi:imidazoleglycerol-phosphate dehydratase|nr:imidazoleglycerol-phosphate dehydratase HisB [Thermomicrobiales bacterium]
MTSLPIRTRSIERHTRETKISVTVDLDGSGEVDVETGVPFLDHMLDALGRHGQLNLWVRCAGDVEIDPHHSVEDVGIVIGLATREALGDRAGIARYAHAYAPLDEALSRTVIDVSGRPYFHFTGEMPEPQIGADFAASLIEEFWRAFAMNSGFTMHIDLLRSRNSHHAAEAIFKSAALAIHDATRVSRSTMAIPSTKGLLG